MIKKSAALSAILALGLSASAFAYENMNAGYSVNDKDPFMKFATSKLYGYSDLQANKVNKIRDNDVFSAHIVSHYTAEEMEKIVEEPYSDAYFDKEYDKLVALKNADISMETVPTKLVEIDRYDFAKLDDELNSVQKRYIEKLKETVKPVLRVDKLQGRKAITTSYKFEQNKIKYIFDVTYMTANNTLYQLVTVTQDHSDMPEPEVTVKDDGTIEVNDKDEIVTKGDLRDKVSKAMAVKNLKDSDIGQAKVKKYWKTHTNMIKGFKTFAPASEKNKQSFGYYDDAMNRQVPLPEDWMYAQYSIREDEGSGNITLSGPVPSFERMGKEIDYNNMLAIAGVAEDEIFDDTEDVKPTDEDVLDKPMTPEEQVAQMEKAKQASIEEGKKVLKEFDSALITASMKMNKSDFYDMLMLDVSNEIMAKIFLDKEISELRKMETEYFKFNSLDYKYNLSSDKNKVSLEVIPLMKFFQETDINGYLKLMAAKDKQLGSMVMYAEKPDFAQKEELKAVLDSWQF